MKQAFRLFLPLFLILALLVSCGKEEAPPDPTELAPKDFSLRGLEPIRFIAANRGVCFGKNSCNIVYYFKFSPRIHSRFVRYKLLRTNRASNF